MNKLTKNSIIIFIIGCVICVLGNLVNDGFQYQNLQEFIVDFSFYQLYAFAIGISNLYYFDFLEHFNWRKNQGALRIFVGITGSIIITTLILFLIRGAISTLYSGKSFIEFIQNESLRNYQFAIWITATIVTIFHVIYFYNRYQQKKVKEQKVIAGTANAKFDALKNQLDPHFLFNSLNVLTSLIEENPENAQRFTTSLSKVYRYVLEQKNKELVTVDEELQFAKTYMLLLKMRFEDSIVFEIPEKAQDPESKVVPLSLQLLLENAVKHNMVNSSNPLHIRIYEDQGMLVVENNLQTKQIVKKSSGVGLENIKQRYELLTTRTVDINQDAKRFAVAIPMLTKQLSIMETEPQSSSDNAYYQAKKRVEEIKGFYGNVLSYCLVIPALVLINYNTSWKFQWFWFPMLGWGMGLVFHAFGVFGYGKSWEERKIKEILEREKTSKNWK